MERENLTLEYIKVLIWPMILISGFAFYSETLFGIIENREIDAFGLKIGKQVEEVSNNYKTELEALKASIANSKDSALLKKVEIIELNLERELEQVKKAALNKEAPSASIIRKDKVVKLENDGFTAIINRDLTGAIEAFTEASDVWSEYHNVAEIQKLLSKNKEQLTGDETATAWSEVINTINDKYSWGMSADIREQMIK